jgi:putative peptidoglycan lipid II flippase
MTSPQVPEREAAVTPPARRPLVSSVAAGALIVSGGALASRLLGYVRDALLLHAFGTSGVYGAYTMAFVVPDQLYYWLAGGTLGAAFIPVFASLLGRGEQEDADKVGSTIANLMLLIISVGVAIEFVFMPFFVRIIAPGFVPGSDVFNLTVMLSRIMCVTVLFTALSGLLSGMLNAYHHFLYQTVAWLAWNLAILFGITVLSKLPLFGGSPAHPSIYGVAVSVVIGTILLVAVQIPIVVRYGFRYRPIIDLAHKGVKSVIANFIPVMFGLAASQFSLMSVPKIMGTLVGESAVGDISTAIKLATVPLGLFGMAIATASFPQLARQAGLGQRDEFRKTIAGAIKAILFLSVPATVALFVLAEPANYLLWGGGQFDQGSVEATAFILMFLAWNLLGLSVMQVTNRAFFSLGDTVTPMFVSIAMTVANIGLSWVLVHQPSLSYAGIAVSTTATTTVAALVLMELLRRKLGGIHGGSILLMTAKVGAAALLMGVAMYLVGHRLAPTVPGLGALAPVFRWPAPYVPFTKAVGAAVVMQVPKTRLLIQFLSSGGIGVAVYALMVWGLRVDEARTVGARLMAKLFKRGAAAG